jgi:hypothetical protein
MVNDLLFKYYSHQTLIMYWLVANGGHTKFNSEEFAI